MSLTKSISKKTRPDRSAFPAATKHGSPQIHSFGRVHCAQDFDIANLAMVEVDGGYVAIDTGSSPSICEKVDLAWRRISGGLVLRPLEMGGVERSLPRRCAAVLARRPRYVGIVCHATGGVK